MTSGTAESVSVSLDEETTRALLFEAPSAYRTQINDLLLAAMAQACAEWTGSGRLLIDLEGHGRETLFEDVDVSRTVGWFTTLYPVLLELPDDKETGKVLQAIKEQLRAIPQQGIGYGLLRYLSGDEELATRLGELPQAEIGFNYLGQVERGLPAASGLGAAREASGPRQSPQAVRRHALEINGAVFQDRLTMTWTFSPERHRRTTVEVLANQFAKALEKLVQHCQSAEAGGYTPSDFPLAGLDQGKLDELLKRFG
jgi:non-ribosomal peptide synthase protein (TIGR01720 family)